MKRPALTALIAILFSAPAFCEEGNNEHQSDAATENQNILRKWNTFLRSHLNPPKLDEIIREHSRAQPNSKLREDFGELQPAPYRLSKALESVAPFEEPESIKSVNGVLNATLEVKYTENTHIGGEPVRLRSYNGKIGGPTLVCKPGDTLRIKLINNLPPIDDPGEHNTFHELNITNLHFHGLHVSPSGKSDNVFINIYPGKQFDYEVKIPDNHPCGTFWYHAHRHGSVAAQTSSGMAGAIVIKGGQDYLPELSNIRENILLLQQIPFIMAPDRIGTVELNDAEEMFGPGDWDKLGRYTTINGSVLPVLGMRPGEVVRWRIINSGFREPIRLRLVKAPDSSGQAVNGPPTLDFQEINVDGIPRGRKVPKHEIEMWPGYREDVLIQAPLQEAEYLLVDDRVKDDASSESKSRKYLARVKIAGIATPMSLPNDTELSKFRPKSISSNEVSGKQSAVYGVNTREEVPSFEINNAPYEMTHSRVLPYGKAEDWVLESVNTVDGVPSPKPINHPFHIHTNSFEVYSILDENGQETLLDEQGKLDPVWRDTVVIRSGHKVFARMRYEDYTGCFVQHCHVLDHEDLGMMENVEIRDELKDGPASEIALPIAFRAWKGQRFLAVLIRSLDCPACKRQVLQIQEAFASGELPCRPVIVTPDLQDDIEVFRSKKEFQMLEVISDTSGTVARRYFNQASPGLHSVILMDENLQAEWKLSGEEPVPKEQILKKFSRPAGAMAAPSVVPRIDINNTPGQEDDYVTWAPTPCRIKRPSGWKGEGVTLSCRPLNAKGGRVLFAASLRQGDTATIETVTIPFQKDAQELKFYLAGKFGFPSCRDKDCLIEAHDSTTGELVASVPLMVRVRKSLDRLDEVEKRALLKAIRRLDNGFPNSVYRNTFVLMHILASGRDKMNPWPDQAHKGSGFPPWHRAFGLQFERELQKIDPSVALPYWRMDVASSAFVPEFLGGNRVSDEIEEDVTFSPANPLFGWGATLRNPTTIQLLKRNGKDHSKLPMTQQTGTSEARPFQKEEDILSESTYREFRASFEPNPHNVGHVWLGGRWSHGCMFPAADPVFWMFHCELDRLWAKWQWRHGRFDSSGQREENFGPVGRFDLGGEITMGHYLRDSMWPWDGTKGFQIEGLFRAHRPDINPFEAFPASVLPNTWPPNEASPTPADMIDYLGSENSAMNLGFCFDDVPFGIQSVPSPFKTKVDPTESTDHLLDLASRKELDDKARILVMQSLGRPISMKHAEQLVTIGSDKANSDDVCLASYSLLLEASSDESADLAIQLTKNDRPRLRLLGAQWLCYLNTFSPDEPGARPKIEAALAALRDSGDQAMAREALINDVRTGSAKGFADLEALLLKMVADRKGQFALTLTEALRFSAGVRSEPTVKALSSLLNDQTPLVAEEAILALNGEPSTSSTRLQLVRDASHPLSTRIAAIRSLLHEKSALDQLAIELTRNNKEPVALRATAVAALRVLINDNLSSLSEDAISDFKVELAKIAGETTSDYLETVINSNLELF